jgi:hypothetical protein
MIATWIVAGAVIASMCAQDVRETKDVPTTAARQALPKSLDTIGPLVAKIMMRPMPTDVPLRSGTDADVEAAVLEQGLVKLAAQTGMSVEELRTKHADQLKRNSLWELAATSTRALGMFDYTKRVILVQMGRADRLLLEVEPSLTGAEREAERERLLHLVVAHEWTHALQHAEVSMGDYVWKREGEPVLARRACLEGQAVLAQELVAAELAKTDPAYARTAKHLRTMMPGGRAAKEGAAPVNGEEQREGQSYTGGFQHMKRIYDKGGMEATWTALKNPPSTMAAILSPDAKLDDSKSAAVGDALTAALSKGLGPDVRVMCKALSPNTVLSREFAALPPERRTQLTNAATLSIALVGSDRAQESRLVGAVIQTTDDASAQEFLELIRKPIKETISTLGIAAEEATPTIDGVECQTAKGSPKAVPLSLHFLTARQGNVVIYVMTMETAKDLFPPVDQSAAAVIGVLRERGVITSPASGATKASANEETPRP